MARTRASSQVSPVNEPVNKPDEDVIERVTQRGLDLPEPDEDAPPIDFPDERDTVKRQPTQKFSGKVVKAKPTHGGSTVEMRPEDWANVGIQNHPLVKWDFLINHFMVPAEALSEEALTYLLEHDGDRFEVIENPN